MKKNKVFYNFISKNKQLFLYYKSNCLFLEEFFLQKMIWDIRGTFHTKFIDNNKNIIFCLRKNFLNLKKNSINLNYQKINWLKNKRKVLVLTNKIYLHKYNLLQYPVNYYCYDTSSYNKFFFKKKIKFFSFFLIKQSNFLSLDPLFVFKDITFYNLESILLKKKEIDAKVVLINKEFLFDDFYYSIFFSIAQKIYYLLAEEENNLFLYSIMSYYFYNTMSSLKMENWDNDNFYYDFADMEEEKKFFLLEQFYYKYDEIKILDFHKFEFDFFKIKYFLNEKFEKYKNIKLKLRNYFVILITKINKLRSVGREHNYIKKVIFWQNITFLKFLDVQFFIKWNFELKYIDMYLSDKIKDLSNIFIFNIYLFIFISKIFFYIKEEKFELNFIILYMYINLKKNNFLDILKNLLEIDVSKLLIKKKVYNNYYNYNNCYKPFFLLKVLIHLFLINFLKYLKNYFFSNLCTYIKLYIYFFSNSKLFVFIENLKNFVFLKYFLYFTIILFFFLQIICVFCFFFVKFFFIFNLIFIIWIKDFFYFFYFFFYDIFKLKKISLITNNNYYILFLYFIFNNIWYFYKKISNINWNLFYFFFFNLVIKLILFLSRYKFFHSIVTIIINLQKFFFFIINLLLNNKFIIKKKNSDYSVSVLELFFFFIYKKLSFFYKVSFLHNIFRNWFSYLISILMFPICSLNLLFKIKDFYWSFFFIDFFYHGQPGWWLNYKETNFHKFWFNLNNFNKSFNFLWNKYYLGYTFLKKQNFNFIKTNLFYSNSLFLKNIFFFLNILCFRFNVSLKFFFFSLKNNKIKNIFYFERIKYLDDFFLDYFISEFLYFDKNLLFDSLLFYKKDFLNKMYFKNTKNYFKKYINKIFYEFIKNFVYIFFKIVFCIFKIHFIIFYLILLFLIFFIKKTYKCFFKICFFSFILLLL